MLSELVTIGVSPSSLNQTYKTLRLGRGTYFSVTRAPLNSRLHPTAPSGRLHLSSVGLYGFQRCPPPSLSKINSDDLDVLNAGKPPGNGQPVLLQCRDEAFKPYRPLVRGVPGSLAAMIDNQKDAAA